ncbi:MAG: hypothetical protein STSR0002_17810 [Smithella sp.]
MKTILNIMGDLVVSEFRQWSLNCNVSFKSPRFKCVECDDFNKGSEGSACGLLGVFGIMEHFCSENLLELVN